MEKKIQVGGTFMQIPGLTEDDLTLPEVFPLPFLRWKHVFSIMKVLPVDRCGSWKLF